jgi:phospholipase A-2-activating protein
MLTITSWKSTAIVWKNFQKAYVLQGHEEAVWSVLPVKQDVILTGTRKKNTMKEGNAN